MFAALVVILTLPILDLGKTKGFQFRPLSRLFFYAFVVNFLVLLQLGAKHVEDPFVFFGQVSTALYFIYFLVIVPTISII